MTKRFNWSPDAETDLTLQWADPHTTAHDVAAAMGITPHQAMNRARKLGLKKAAKGRDYQIVEIDGDGSLGLLVPGGGSDHIVWIDADKYEWFSSYLWCVHNERQHLYVIRADSQKLHRALVDAPDDLLVDHEDRDGLNNRSRNIRVATYAQNTHNSGPHRNARSIYKGVWLHECGKYSGAIKCPNGGRKRVGYYETEYQAARAHDVVAKHYRGKFAFQNLPDDPMTSEEIEKIPRLRFLLGEMPTAGRWAAE